MTEATLQEFNSARFDIAGAEINLYGTPVSTVFARQIGEKLYVAYAEHDPSAENPLKAGDGMGAIYSAQRNSSTASEMQAALGLDSEWSPNLENELVQRAAAKMAVTVLLANPDFVAKAYAHFGISTPDALTEALWQNFFDPTVYHPQYLTNVFPDAPADEATYSKDAWIKALAEGLLGNPFRVSLDVYDHGLVSYSVGGEGYQCRWDTARGGALWVPDAYLEQQLWGVVLATQQVTIEEKGAEYEWQPTNSDKGQDFGDGIKKEYNKVREAVFTLLQNGVKVSTHTSFDQAKDAALKLLGDSLDRPAAFASAQPKAREYARQACEAYTSWTNGDSHCIVQEEWDLLKGNADDGEFDAGRRDSTEYTGDGLTLSDAETEVKDWLKGISATGAPTATA